MASYSKSELLKKFKAELKGWWDNKESHHGKDTTHIQMASVDEMMAALGYAPRLLPNYPEVKDGRFGYYRVWGSEKHPLNLSFEDAVSLHNNCVCKARVLAPDAISFALRSKIVQQVAVQRLKGKGEKGQIKSQKRWIKFED